MASNKRLVMVVGESGSGKTASLRELEDQPGVMFFNCESGKEIPFKNKFNEVVVDDPYIIFDALDEVRDDPDVHTIVIDSLTMLMEMFESVHVITAADTRKAWGDYAQFFKTLMQQYVATMDKRFIFIAHTESSLNNETGVMEVKVPVKGALAKISIEAYFSIIVAAKKVRVKELEKYENDMLEITPREENVGFKHVFQTLPTKATVGEKMRGPFDLWTDEQTYINNNAQWLLEYIDSYYE
ncbi:Sak4-like ssDNA annealing protein [Acinetobacter phage Presley]|uniref:AAA ATPase n=1 Tax=Acinetobacter phage Presley TaxID=1406780 RepID=U5PW40_9CAUD|nr:Sak4-like ssDNA annealing protein [Acinetobacter phage Presley]AGY48134.1 AAA ATPase [Acinetobacter phage Presley]